MGKKETKKKDKELEDIYKNIYTDTHTHRY